MKKHGLALIETIASITILAILVLAFAYLSKGGMNRRNNDREECQNLINDLISSVDFNKNSLNMRNFFPSTASNAGPAADALDPFCNPARLICDSNPFYGLVAPVRHPNGFFRKPVRLFVGGAYQTLHFLDNHQNNRGAAAWAQSLYNQRAVAGGDATLCSGNGSVIGSPVALAGMLPQPGQLGGLPNFYPAAAQGLLYIKDSAVPCGTRSIADAQSEGVFDVKATITYPGANGAESCFAATRVTYPRDNERPTVTIRMTNGGGTLITSGGKSDGGVFTGGAEYKTVNIDITASEAGLVYLCRHEGPVLSDPPSDYTICSEISLPGSAATITPDYTTTPTYYKPANMRITFAGLNDNPLPYGLEITAIDGGGNFIESRISFIVQSP